VNQESSPLDEVVLDSVMGHAIVQWHLGEGGMHLVLDDGRALIILGQMGVLSAETTTVH
jgi:hypothetical protein